MKHLVVIFLSFSFICLKSQPISLNKSGEIRALVIGISDYQDERISDLKYADKDAEAFAEFLASEAGYGMSEDQILLLTNENATAARFDAALGWLLDETKEGDQVIIYFSGHGDMETKTRRQLGYLLCWDTPPQSYIMGSMPIYYFNSYIETLTLDNKANVIIITDACHAGKLAGNEINGSQLTNANLAKVYNNEIKILSCQPGELSIEGEQWGGGRGAFSYHLIEGLYGLADQNSDLNITLSELDRYLEEKVTSEVAPESQLPLVQGNRRHILRSVDEEQLKIILQAKKNTDVAFATTDSKGILNELFKKLDESSKEKYKAYKAAIEKKYFFEWSVVDRGCLKACADQIYRELIVDENFTPLHNHLKRNYAAALQDDAQQFFNAVMKGDLSSIGLSKLAADNKRLQSFPKQLERAAELLGSEHHIYKNLKAKQEYFNAVSAKLKNPFSRNKNDGEVILSHLKKSLKWQPEMAQTYSFIGFIYANNINSPDSAIYYVEKAVDLSPSWVLPYASVAEAFFLNGKYALAEEMINKAEKIDPNSVLVLNTKGRILRELGNKSEAENMFLKATQIEPEWSVPFKNLSYLYLISGDFEQAEKMADQAISKNPEEIRAIQVLAWTYIYTNRATEAEALLLKALALDKNNFFDLNFDLSCYYSLNNNLELAFDHLSKALEFGYTNYKRLHSDSDLENMRAENQRWKLLMNKYFPDRNTN